MEYENTFVREVKEKSITNPADILNWYRNLYHTEDNHTEHGIVAYAINDFFADVVPKSEVVNEITSHLAGLYDFFKQNDDIREAYAILFAIAELKKKYTEGEK